MSPPPDSSSGGLVPRTDAGARKLIERIDLLGTQVTHRLDAYAEKLETLEEHIESQLKRMEAKVKARPTKAKMIALIAGCAIPLLGLFFTITWQISTRVADSSEKQLLRTLETFKEAIQAQIKASDLTHQTEHRAIYDSVPRRRRSEVLERPPETKVPSEDDNT